MAKLSVQQSLSHSGVEIPATAGTVGAGGGMALPAMKGETFSLISACFFYMVHRANGWGFGSGRLMRAQKSNGELKYSREWLLVR